MCWCMEDQEYQEGLRLLEIKLDIKNKLSQLKQPFSMLDVIEVLAQFPEHIRETDEFKRAYKEITDPFIKQLVKEG